MAYVDLCAVLERFRCGRSDLNFLPFSSQIAAKIGGDGVPPAPSPNEFSYGGQKRPLEDAGMFSHFFSALEPFTATLYLCLSRTWFKYTIMTSFGTPELYANWDFNGPALQYI